MQIVITKAGRMQSLSVLVMERSRQRGDEIAATYGVQDMDYVGQMLGEYIRLGSRLKKGRY